MKKLVSYLFVLACIFSSCRDETDLQLSGEWSFVLDPDDVGIAQQWYNKPLADRINLPGSLQEQGYGDEVDVSTKWTGQIVDSTWFKSDIYAKYRQKGNIRISFWLQPEKHYVGVAWYQKEITVPSSWKNNRVELELERTHWETTLFVNGKEVGKNNSLQTPHRYKIDGTGKLSVSIRVDNRVHIPVGVNAHSVSDHTQSNWNGIVGNIRLSAKPSLYIDYVQVFPDIKAKKAKVIVHLAGALDGGKPEMTLRARSFNCHSPAELHPVSKSFSSDRKSVELELDMGDGMLTWSEFEPNLYRMDVELNSKEGKDRRTVEFGMREFKAEGTRFHINGTPVFLRGTLECAIFPLTGYASMDAAYWEKIYRQCKNFGLNHVRFHSWCPPRVAFEVADREGIYLQVECGGWAWIGDGKYIDDWFYEESERIVKEYGNHPSFCMMAYGNEPHGGRHTEYLSKFVDHWKAKDTRFVYTSGAGWPYLPNTDYWNTPNPRIQHWGAGLNSIINAKPPQTAYDFADIVRSKTMPVVSHEIGQWCVYPNFKEIPEYTGVLKAKNFEIFQETLAEHNMGDLSGQFLYASGRLQTLCYKADIEAALRTPGFAGFQLLDLHDFPGQGTALVGVLDPFWNTKGYVDAPEYSSFCNRTVPLARMEKLLYLNDEVFNASVEVSNFAGKALQNASIEWKITDTSGKELLKASKKQDLPIDNCIQVTNIEYPLSGIEKPSQLQLSVNVEGGSLNKWNFWVYPSKQEGSRNKPFVTNNYTEAINKAQAGGNVLYCLPKDALKPEKGGNISVGFSSIFWNTAWTRGQAPHTLGVFCDPQHPALALFPNEGYSDYQWWDIVAYSSAMVMDDFPASFRPVVHLIDDWFTNRKLGILFETRVGEGKLMTCSVDFTKDMGKRPAAKQFRHSIEEYMVSERFNPSAEIDPALIKGLLK
jgi:hypothetical protein